MSSLLVRLRHFNDSLADEEVGEKEHAFKHTSIDNKWREKGPKYGRQLNCGHESQLKGPPKNAITTQLQKVRGQRHKNVSGYFFSFIT